MKEFYLKKKYIEESGYQPALAIETFLSFSKTGVLTGLLGLTALGFLFAALSMAPQQSPAWTLLGLAEITGGFFLAVLIYRLFCGSLQKDRPIGFSEIRKALHNRDFGLALSFESAMVLEKTAEGDSLNLRKYFDFLLSHRQFFWILERLNVPLEKFREKVRESYAESASLALDEVLLTAWQKALGGNHLHILPQDILAAVFDLDQVFQKILFEYEVKADDLLAVAYWQRRIENDKKMKGRFWERKNLLNIQGIGKGWAGGFTVNLDKIAADLTESIKFQKPPKHLYGHRRQLELLEQMLLRPGGSRNVVLTGPPGAGRHTLLRAFAAKVAAGETLPSLRYQRLLQIDAGSVIAGTISLNQVVERIQALFAEAVMAKNVILVVNDIDAFFDSRPEAGRVNATEAMLPFLKTRMPVIGIVTSGGYQNTIGKNPQLLELLPKLEIIEPSAKMTVLILQDEAEKLEAQAGLKFTYQALREIVRLAGKLIQNLPNPEKSLEILEETAVFVATKTRDWVVLPSHVQKVVTIRTKIPVEKVAGEEKELLLNLEAVLHERIIGQHEAIAEVADALRRARAGVRSESRPIGTFLFLGPTGVGKTETAKALARVYFGSEKRIMRFDMSEFQEEHGVDRLIGGAAGGESGGFLTEAVIANPFGLILLDELEKASPKVLDLFLQVFDEGRLTDAQGRAVSFVSTMIIATSNAGAETVREMVRGGRNPAKERGALLDELQRSGIFRPEFLNRFDGVIVFRPLSEAELVEVAMLLLRDLNERLKEKDVQVRLTSQLAQAVAKGGFSAEFGARPLRRFIQEHIENYVARGLLSGKIQRGDTVEIPLEMLATSRDG